MNDNKVVILKVADMTCEHCVRTVTKAIQNVYPLAQVDINLAEHTVKVSGGGDAAQLAHFIEEEGYSVEID